MQKRIFATFLESSYFKSNQPGLSPGPLYNNIKCRVFDITEDEAITLINKKKQINLYKNKN